MTSTTSPKLVIQIPCLNEADHLPSAIAALPKEIPGIGSIEIIVIDDGSSDDTARVALECGAAEVVSMGLNRGLARAFQAGLRAALRRGADIVVNTDADNQYDASCIPVLVAPILERKADLVIGARPIDGIEHFSPVKKFLQRLGSRAVRFASSSPVEDAPSGFRAMSRHMAENMVVLNDFTYTVETIIHAGRRRFVIENVPVKVNGETRPSRLFRSIHSYVFRSMGTILRFWLAYRAQHILWGMGAIGLLTGLVWAFVGLLMEGYSILPGLVFACISILMLAAGTLADLMLMNRRLLEENRVTMNAVLAKLEKLN